MGACKDNEYDFSVCSMAVDREAIVDVAAQNPGQEAVVLTTTAPCWIVQTPYWITPDATTGHGEQSIITVNQLGYTAPVDPDASIGGITDMDEFKDFVAAVNNGRSLFRWFNEAGVAPTVRPER